jgi:aspartyl-tRNA(Asn)/glutamyl-tRNA(Gln) amidotransferase subunit C
MNETSRRALDVAEVERMAGLSHLGLDADEKASMARELAKILAFAEQLTELDVSGVEPTTQIGFEGPRPMRADEPEPELPHEIALSQAPKTAEGGFSVPAFVDEG